MNARNSKLAAYQSVSAQAAVAGADPHALVLLLMDGALQRLAAARGCLERRDIVQKAKLLHSSVTLIAELRGVLNLDKGGPIAQNLNELYAYMIRRLVFANAANNGASISEVHGLLSEIRGAWVAIGPQVRQGFPAGAGTDPSSSAPASSGPGSATPAAPAA